MIAAAYWCFVAVVVLAPLPYGAVHVWSYSLLALLTGALTVLWALAAAVDDRAYAVGWRHYAVPGAMFVAVLAWIAIQACPGVPLSWQDPLWTEARAVLGNRAEGAISIDPDVTLLVLMRMATYGAVFWIAMQLCRDRRRATLAMWAIAMAGLAYAAYGIGVQASGSETILFAKKWAYQHSLTSTLVNRNHYAIYAGIGLTTSLGLLIVRARRNARGAFLSLGLMLRSLEDLDLSVFVLALDCIVLATALILSQSRGGLLFTGIALLFLVGLLSSGGNVSRRASLVIVLAMAVGVSSCSG